MDTTATTSSPSPMSYGALKAAEQTQSALASQLISATEEAQRSTQAQRVEQQQRSDQATISPEAKALLAKEIGG